MSMVFSRKLYLSVPVYLRGILVLLDVFYDVCWYFSGCCACRGCVLQGVNVVGQNALRWHSWFVPLLAPLAVFYLSYD
jgi:hypothetical protein